MGKEIAVKEFVPAEGVDFGIGEGINNSGYHLHAHNYCELCFVVSGSGTHIFNGALYSLEQGDVFSIKGEQYHGYKDCRELRLYNIAIEHKCTDKLNGEVKDSEGFKVLFEGGKSSDDFLYKKFEGEKYGVIFGLLESIQYELNFKEEGYLTLCESYLTQLVCFLSREFGERKQRNPRSAILADTVKYIKQNPAKQMTSQELADIAHLSVRHFIRIFKEAYNDTPANYILKLRLEMARNILKDGQYNVCEVSGMCGFKYSNYFSKMFKKAYGVTPKAYKNSDDGILQ